MISFASADISLVVLAFLGFVLGLVSGFIGVGGGFLMTPILIILGFPAHLAVGTSLTWVMGNSIIGCLRHRQLGNVDTKLGALLVVGTIGGIEVGTKILNWLKASELVEVTVLAVSIGVLILVCIYTYYDTLRKRIQLRLRLHRQKESLHPKSKSNYPSKRSIHLPAQIYFHKSGITISLLVVLGTGFTVGLFSGFIGIGGGILMMPSLIYMFGLTSFMAVGTDIFQVIFAAAYGVARHTMSGNVVIVAAVVMVLGSSIGTQLGVLATRYASELSMRYVFATSVLIAVLASGLKLAESIWGNTVNWLQNGAIIVTFGGLGIILLMIAVLTIGSTWYRNTKVKCT